MQNHAILNFEMSNKDKIPLGTDGAGKVPNTNKTPVRSSEAKNNQVELTTITEVSSTEVKVEIKEGKFPFCKRNAGTHRSMSDKPAQTDDD